MATADLRPMTLGEVLDRTFTIYRANFILFAGIMAMPYLVLLLFRFALLLWSRSSLTGPNPAVSPGMMGGFFTGVLGVAVVTMLVVGVAQAATVYAVSELYLGRNTSIGESYSRAKGVFLVVVAIMFLTGLATGIGLILLIVPGIYIACRLAVSVPVAIVEQESTIASMERSMELTRGFAWQVFLLFLLTFVISWVVGMLLQAPVMVFSVAAVMAKQQPSLGMQAYSYVAEYLGQVVVGPVGTISACLMYYNLRVRKEGFDIQHLMNMLGNAPRPLAEPIQ